MKTLRDVCKYFAVYLGNYLIALSYFHPEGASEPFCHENNGQCQCLSKVVGQKCDRCLFGYWNINSGSGCEKCNCDAMGAYDTDCDDKTGQCRCKTGVGELSCSSCLEGYWGFSSRGCISRLNTFQKYKGLFGLDEMTFWVLYKITRTPNWGVPGVHLPRGALAPPRNCTYHIRAQIFLPVLKLHILISAPSLFGTNECFIWSFHHAYF